MRLTAQTGVAQSGVREVTRRKSGWRRRIRISIVSRPRLTGSLNQCERRHALRILRIVKLSSFALAIALALAAPAVLAAEDCSKLVINHSFSQQFEGFLNVPAYFSGGGPPNLGLVPTAGAGFITFHHGGKVSGQVTLAIGLLGLVPDIVFDTTSEYSLSWDTTKMPAVCSGAVTLNAPGESFHFQLLVSPDGQGIQMIHTDAGLIVGVTGFPLETTKCSNNSLDGKYSYNLQGWALAPPGSFPPEQLLAGYLPFAFSGAMEFQPRASAIVWWDTASINGVIVPRTGTGSYKVNPNCTGTMVLKDNSSGQEFHLELFVGKNGGALYLVNIDTATIPGLPAPVPLFVLGMGMNRVDREWH